MQTNLQQLAKGLSIFASLDVKNDFLVTELDCGQLCVWLWKGKLKLSNKDFNLLISLGWKFDAKTNTWSHEVDV